LSGDITPKFKNSDDGSIWVEEGVTRNCRSEYREDPQGFCSSPDTVRVIRNRRYGRHGKCGEIEMHAGLCWGHLKEGSNLVDLGVDGGQIKIILQEIRWEGVYRVGLAQDMAVVG
jgi:hypothetical protein